MRQTRLQAAWNRWQQAATIATQALILFIFFCATWWWRPRLMLAEWVPDAIRDGLMSPFNSDAYLEVYFARFAHTAFIILLVGLWAATLFRGLRQLGDRLWWVIGLGLLVFWIWLSVDWAAVKPAVARSQAWQWTLVFAFVLVVVSNGPPIRWITMAIVAGVIFQGTLGIAQVAMQRELGLSWIDENLLKLGVQIYEFRLDPAQSGVSVIQSGGIRYLRAYGITSHPNLLGAGLVMGLLTASWLWLKPEMRRTAAWVTALMLWALLLTFSRASMGGLIVGGVVIGVLWWCSKNWRWDAALGALVLAVLVGAVFYMLYRPLVDVRLGRGEEGAASVEGISVEARKVYIEQARTVIDDYPIRGVGIANFPWVSAQMIHDDPRNLDMKGDYVHRVYLVILTELGIVGAILWGGTLGVSGWLLWRRWHYGQLSPEIIALCGGIVAWLAISWFEFFPWALLPYQVLFWGALAAAIRQPLARKETRMQPIVLEHWRLKAGDGEFSSNEVDVSSWETVTLPLDGIVETVTWLRCVVQMPPNDECSTWWLEMEGDIAGEVWVNGQRVGELEATQEITQFVAMGDNHLVLKLTGGGTALQRVCCVPHPCM